MKSSTKIQEIYRTVKNYPNYQVSNFGNVKSLWNGKQRILKQTVNSSGYLHVGLCKNSKRKSRTIHQLVASAFLRHKPDGTHKLVINHINFNKLNNRVENLEIVTQRENSNRKHIKSSSQHTGVSWDKSRNRWLSQITINGKKKHLGRFKTEIEASEIYKEALTRIPCVSTVGVVNKSC